MNGKSVLDCTAVDDEVGEGAGEAICVRQVRLLSSEWINQNGTGDRPD